jgi:hypothetical protein
MSERGCTIPDCGGKHYAHGYCKHHYDCNGPSVDERMRKPLKSDNLRLPDISGALEANLVSLIRPLPGRGKS